MHKLPVEMRDTLPFSKVTLLDGVDKDRTGLSFFREYLKLLLRAFFNPSESKEWIFFWNSNPFLHQLAFLSPQLIKKIFRPYFTKQLNCRDRLRVITAHYEFVIDGELNALVMAALKAPAVLVEFAGKSGLLYQLELVAVRVMEREGELVVQLSTEGIVLYSLAFTFFKDAGNYHIGVGCLQGGKAPNALELIRKATRDMFGLRPKTLLIKTIQQLGHQFACKELRLVGNGNRVVTQPLRKGKVIADYDETWLELKAIRLIDGDYSLPCEQLSAPNYEEIASSKRSEARKRFSLLSTISHSFCECFQKKH